MMAVPKQALMTTRNMSTQTLTLPTPRMDCWMSPQ